MPRTSCVPLEEAQTLSRIRVSDAADLIFAARNDLLSVAAEFNGIDGAKVPHEAVELVSAVATPNNHGTDYSRGDEGFVRRNRQTPGQASDWAARNADRAGLARDPPRVELLRRWHGQHVQFHIFKID